MIKEIRVNNIQKYINAFVEAFTIPEENVENLKYQDIEEWDSVGHMSLMALIEDAFEIMMDIDDIIDFGSFLKGKEILAKYNVIL